MGTGHVHSEMMSGQNKVDFWKTENPDKISLITRGHNMKILYIKNCILVVSCCMYFTSIFVVLQQTNKQPSFVWQWQLWSIFIEVTFLCGSVVGGGMGPYWGPIFCQNTKRDCKHFNLNLFHVYTFT